MRFDYLYMAPYRIEVHKASGAKKPLKALKSIKKAWLEFVKYAYSKNLEEEGFKIPHSKTTKHKKAESKEQQEIPQEYLGLAGSWQKVAEYFIEKDLIDIDTIINTRNNKSYPVLHYAAQQGMNKIVSMIITKIPEAANLSDYQGYTALHYVVGAPRTTLGDDVAVELAERMTDKVIFDTNQNNKHTVMELAIKYNVSAYRLLKIKPVLMNVADNEGRTVLHWAVKLASDDYSYLARSENDRLFKLLILLIKEMPQNMIDSLDSEGHTAFDLAVQRHSTQTPKFEGNNNFVTLTSPTSVEQTDIAFSTEASNNFSQVQSRRASFLLSYRDGMHKIMYPPSMPYLSLTLYDKIYISYETIKTILDSLDNDYPPSIETIKEQFSDFANIKLCQLQQTEDDDKFELDVILKNSIKALKNANMVFNNYVKENDNPNDEFYSEKVIPVIKGNIVIEITLDLLPNLEKIITNLLIKSIYKLKKGSNELSLEELNNLVYFTTLEGHEKSLFILLEEHNILKKSKPLLKEYIEILTALLPKEICKGINEFLSSNLNKNLEKLGLLYSSIGSTLEISNEEAPYSKSPPNTIILTDEVVNSLQNNSYSHSSSQSSSTFSDEFASNISSLNIIKPTTRHPLAQECIVRETLKEVLLLVLHEDICEIISEYLSFISAKNLFEAVKEENLKGVIGCLEEGVKVDSQDQFKRTALHIATSNKFPKIMGILINKNADVNIQDENGWTPLYRSVCENSTDCALILLDNKANPNTGDTDVQHTPLMGAANKGNKGMIELLLNNKAEINKAALSGDTALHMAANDFVRSEDRDSEIIKLLIKNGAKILPNNFGETPVDIVGLDEPFSEIFN